MLTSFIKPQMWLFHVVVLQMTAKKWTKVKNARAGHENAIHNYKLTFFGVFHVGSTVIKFKKPTKPNNPLSELGGAV